METKRYIMGGLVLVAVAVLLSFFMGRGDKHVESYVERFCACTRDFGAKQQQYERGRLDVRTYEAAREEHKACLGKGNPFEGLSAADSVAFLRDFVHAVRLECPDVARSAGFRTN